MNKTKSLVTKTFVFTVILVLAILVVVLSILYLLLPGYYFKQKEKSFSASVQKLTAEITPDTLEEDLINKLYEFSVLNNADIISYDKEGNYQPFYSTPYLTLKNVQVTVSVNETQGIEDIISFYGPEADEVEWNQDAFFATSLYGEEESGGGRIIVKEKSTFPSSGGSTVSEQHIQVGERTAAPTTDVLAVEGARSLLPSFSSQLLTSLISLEHPLVDKAVMYGTLQPINEASQVIVSLFPILLLVSLALGLPLAYIYARQLTKPILSLSKTAVAMQDQNPETRAQVDSDNEIGALATNLNSLYGTLIETISLLEEESKQVKKLEQAKTQLMQSASHELKTPLAALNGIIEGMIDKVGVYKDRDSYLKASKEQIDKLDTLVQEILSASQGDNQTLIMEDVALEGLIKQILADQKQLIDQKNLEVVLTVGDRMLHTDLGLLKRALSNLITNGVAYSPLGERLSISMEDRVLTLKNKGPVLGEEELSRLTEPFYTRSFSRDRKDHGTGLGLYIATQNLTRLGYTLQLDYQEPYFSAQIIFET